MVRMICKWCGASLDRSETVCRRCGKEQPALSDCGGFYDLVPSAQMDIPVAPVAAQLPAPQKKKGSAALTVICVLLAVATVVAGMMIASLSARNRELEQDLEEAQEQGGQQLTTSPSSTGPMPTEEGPQSLAQQDVQVTLQLEDQKDSYSMKVASSHPAQVTVKCEPKPLTASITGYTAVVDLADAEESIRAELTLESGETELTLDCTLDEALGQAGEEGFVLDALTYTARDGTVQSLIPEEEDPSESTGEEAASEDSGQTEQPVTVTQEADTAQIILDHSCLRGWLEEKQLDADTKLTCTLVRANDQGGSFTVVVEGITVPQA